VVKEKAEAINIGKRKEEEMTIKEVIKETPKIEEEVIVVKREVEAPKVIRKIDLDAPKKSKPKEPEKEEIKEVIIEVIPEVEEKVEPTVETVEEPLVETEKETEVKPASEEFIKTKTETLSGVKIVGKIELPIKQERRPEDIFRDEEKAKRDKPHSKNVLVLLKIEWTLKNLNLLQKTIDLLKP